MPTGVDGQNLGGAPHGERRASVRYRPSSVAYVQLGAENGGVLLDVSEGGLRLSTGETLGWDDAVPLSLQLSYRADPIQATGQIIWISDSKRTAGLQFVSMSETSGAKLRDWIEGEKNRANLPAASERPAKRTIDFPAPSSDTIPHTASEPVVQAKTRSDRLWEALLDQEPLVEREAPRESPVSMRKQPVPLPTPPLAPEQPSRRRNETVFSPTLEGRAVEQPETDEPPADAGKPNSSKVTQLPSDRLFRKPTPPDGRQVKTGQPDTVREERAATQTPPEQPPDTANTPAAAPPPPSRWGRSEPSAAPPPEASVTPAASQASSADSIRQAFQAKQAAEAQPPRGSQPAAKANSALEAGQVSPLHDDSSSLKFAEWARARGRNGPDFFVDDIHEQHRPGSSHGVLVGGIMLLCFGVGLVLGISYLAGPITVGGFTLPSLRDNGSADVARVTTPAPTEPAANSSTSAKGPAKAPLLNPTPSANATRNPSAPRASQNTNSNSQAGRDTATNDAANTTPPAGNTAASNPPNAPSATSPELAATKESAIPSPAASPHGPPPSSPEQTSPQQPAKTAAPSADDSLAMSHAVTVTPPAEGSPAVWVRLPQIALSASGSAAISVQQSVLVPPASTYGSARANQVVIGGRILSSSVQPLYSAVPIDPNGDVVHLRVWVDPQGDIRQIMPGEGRADLIALAEGEVRGWVQYPPRLAGRSIDSVEDVTITFRP